MFTAVRHCLTVAGLGLLAGLTASASDPRVQLSNVRINTVNGIVQADATLTAPPLPRLNNVTGRIRVSFRVGDAEETVNAAVATVNVKRTVNSTRPFPCNTTLPVTVKVLEPAEVAGHSATTTLTRKCSGSQGTPDLTVVSVTRTDQGLRSDDEYLQSGENTPIQVTVKVKNQGVSAMPNNEQGGTPWLVQVTPGASSSGPTSGLQTVRIALQAGQEHTLTVLPIALPCGKVSDVTVVVDRDKTILESDETNNTKTFKVPGNRCQGRD